MDRALRGRGLLGRGKQIQAKRKSAQEERDDSYAALGRAVTGIEGKPHSNIEGQKYAGARHLTRMWYGRGKDYTEFKKKQKEKKKGTPV